MIKAQAKELGQNGFMINPRDDLTKPVRIELGQDDEDSVDEEGNPIEGGSKSKKRPSAALLAKQRKAKEDIDTENIYAEDPGKLDMIGNLTSTRLLEISERFDRYPGGAVDCE